jgi:hypothetical protein
MIEAHPALWLPSKPAIIRPRTPDLLPPSLAMLMAAKILGANANQGAGGGPHTSLTWRSAQIVNTPGTTFTFNSQAIGTAAADRWVIVATSSNPFGFFPSSVTIGGVAATLIIQASVTSMWAALVPTGTTANIVVNLASTDDRVIMGYWTVSMASGLPTATGAAAATVTGFNIPANGFAVAASSSFSSTDESHSINASFTEQSEFFNNYNMAFSHRDVVGAAVTGLSITATWTNPSGLEDIVVAAWQ